LPTTIAGAENAPVGASSLKVVDSSGSSGVRWISSRDVETLLSLQFDLIIRAAEKYAIPVQTIRTGF
jgi:hypothetical protein